MSRPRLLAVIGTAAAMVLAAAPATPVPAAREPVVSPPLATHLEAVDGLTPVRVLVQAGGDVADATAAVRAAGLTPETTLDRVGIAVAVGTPTQVRDLAARGEVTRLDWADEELVPALETSHVATRALPVHAGAVDVDDDGALDGFDGAGFSVAVVDSGTDGTHPMFADPESGASRVRRNVKMVCSDALPILGGIALDQDPEDPRDEFGPFEACAVDATAVNDTDSPSVGGHGTHVTGIAAGGIVSDAAGRELRGAAPAADVVAVSAGATLSVYAGSLGLYWVLEHHADPCGDGSCPPIVAVNNSWGPAGGGDFSPTAPQALIQRALVAEGVTVVWAAGNDGGDGSANVVNPYSQDPTPGVLSVANYDDAGAGSRDNALNATSSRGRRGDVATYPDLSAPGTDITAACRAWLPVCATGLDLADPDYNTISGTSMAAPHVAGTVAVLQQAAIAATGSRLSPGEVEDLLVDTAHPFGSRTWETDTRNADSTTGTSFDAGHGLLDVLAAVEQVTGRTGQADPPAACPADARFTDPAGDATGALGVGTPLPNASGLDVVEGWLGSDPTTSDVTFHWRVEDLAESPGGLEGNGEYFDVNFSFAGGGYYLQAVRTATDGESYALGRFETTRTTLSTDLTGSFDPVEDVVTVTLPADLIASVVDGAPTLAPGAQIGGIEVVGRRELVLVVPDADTATSPCAYTVGAELTDDDTGGGGDPNTAPVVDEVTATSERPQHRTGEPITFTVTAGDADGDALTHTWDFGDGATATGATVTHTYADGGTRTATVTVSDGSASDTGSITVEVHGRPGGAGRDDEGRPVKRGRKG